MGKLVAGARQDRLEHAADLIQDVLNDLNNNATGCKGCSRPTYEHWGEHILFEKLRDQPTKLDKLANEIERGGFSASARALRE